MAEFLQFLSDFVFFYPLFMSIVWMVGGIIFYWRYERKKKTPPSLEDYPMFSVVVPAHNEGEHIRNTIEQLLKLDYPEYEIIVVDDGSSDNTAEIIHLLCKGHDAVRGVYMRQNQGKAVALNTACLISKGEYLLTIDADALLDPQALKWMAWHFKKFPRVGAITGNPRVLNRTTLLAKIQTGEFATIIGMIKRSQRIWGKVMTVSGVIAAFRKEALLSVEFWDEGMQTEDIAVTWKLERKFWDVRFEPHATAWILVPETLKGLFQQRLRWAQGGIEVLLRHGDIWKHWNQRRLWPVFLEYLMSTTWAYAFWTLIGIWAYQAVFNVFEPMRFNPPLPPMWTGSVLAMACLLLFFVGLILEADYDKQMPKYLFWVIWYPFIYWIVNVATAPLAVPKAIFNKNRSGIWTSPDRGIHLKA
ncbi:MAG: poly-beta-1,6-N-acetyl-D-glucosamine synthase [Mariprofundaceae bacterium]